MMFNVVVRECSLYIISFSDWNCLFFNSCVNSEKYNFNRWILYRSRRVLYTVSDAFQQAFRALNIFKPFEPRDWQRVYGKTRCHRQYILLDDQIPDRSSYTRRSRRPTSDTTRRDASADVSSDAMVAHNFSHLRKVRPGDNGSFTAPCRALM